MIFKTYATILSKYTRTKFLGGIVMIFTIPWFWLLPIPSIPRHAVAARSHGEEMVHGTYSVIMLLDVCVLYLRVRYISCVWGFRVSGFVQWNTNYSHNWTYYPELVKILVLIIEF